MRRNLKDIILVSIQFVLFLIFTIDFNWSLRFFHGFKIMGLLMSMAGIIIIVLALLQLNRNISPFPTPKNNAVLLQNGLFKLVRHPIYCGIILLFIGYSLYQNSIFKLIISLLLMILFYYKTQYEEQQLLRKFPEYESYKSNTGKFFPKFFKANK